MTGPVPPPIAAPPEDPATDVRAAAGDEDRVRSARGCAWWSVGLTVVAVLLCGAGTWTVGWILDGQRERLEVRLRELEAEAARTEEAVGLLLDVADRLRLRSADSLPPTLPEAAPKDPWGNPIRYERRDDFRAKLSSAGPDGRFGTADDIVRSLDVGRR